MLANCYLDPGQKTILPIENFGIVTRFWLEYASLY